MDEQPFEMFLADMLRQVAEHGDGKRELELIARMLDGSHLNWRLRATRRTAGNRPDNSERDLAIIRMIAEYRDRIGRGGITAGKSAAMEAYSLEARVVDGIWQRLRYAASPENEQIVMFFDRLARDKRFTAKGAK